MLLEKRDDLLTVAALGLLGYLTADVAHHFLGHGGACWLAGGQILRLSSIVLTCSVTSPLIDLAGPIANFLVGVIALWMAGATARGTLKLFAALSAAFNLFWFAGQMAVSAATRTDDWVWAMTQYQLGAAAQVLLVGTAAALYVGVAHMMSALLADFASSRERLVRICRSAWLAAALVASLTALLDVHPMPALLRHALPQGLLSPFGLLLIPGRALQHASPTTQPAMPRAWRWIGAGIVGAAVSLCLLGAGISLRPV